MNDRNESDNIVQGAANRALLDLVLPAIRRAAKDLGYAIAVHGSMNRDIDIIAIPWTESAQDKDDLIGVITGSICGITGRCYRKEGFTEKPHGRIAISIFVWCGETTTNLDLSIMPRIKV